MDMGVMADQQERTYNCSVWRCSLEGCSLEDLLETIDDKDWFGLVSLFTGILTFTGYLMPKPFS